MAVQPLNPVRNTQTGPLSGSLEISYDLRRATLSAISGQKDMPNLGLGFGDQPLWDGKINYNPNPMTLINHSEGRALSMVVNNGHNIIVTDDTSVEFPKGSLLIRFEVDNSGAKANIVSSGGSGSVNPTAPKGFLINTDTSSNFVSVEMSDDTASTQYEGKWNNFVAGKLYTIIVTWGANGVTSFLDGNPPEVDSSTGTPTTGFVVGTHSNEYRIGRNSSSASTTNRILAFYQWSKELTSPQITALFADPYLPIRQDIKSTLPAGTRGTQLNTDSIAGATKTQWDITGDATFTHTTTATSGAFGSVLSSDLSHLNMWLPPFHNYLGRVRQLVGGSWGEWTPFISFASRGPVNSFENYSILNSGTVTIP